MLAWLARCTPPGAPRVNLYCGELPQIRRPARGDAAALETADVPAEYCSELEILLERPRLDLISPDVTEDVIRPLEAAGGVLRPKLGIRYWRMEAAYGHDLEGFSSTQIADDLGLRDHRRYVGGVDMVFKDRSRSADRYIADGRRMLNALGAWPWALADNGLLPPHWQQEPEYSEALAVWHRAAWIAAAERLELSLDWAAGRRPHVRSTSSTAEELYKAGLLGP